MMLAMMSGPRTRPPAGIRPLAMLLAAMAILSLASLSGGLPTSAASAAGCTNCEPTEISTFGFVAGGGTAPPGLTVYPIDHSDQTPSWVANGDQAQAFAYLADIQDGFFVPLPGYRIRFTVGRLSCSATTDSTGFARCVTRTVRLRPGTTVGITATFAGSLANFLAGTSISDTAQVMADV